MQERVLVMSEKVLDGMDFSKGIIKNNLAAITNKIFSADMFYIDRDKAEDDPSIKQLIPYCVLMNTKGEIFCYKRTKKGGESRLHELWSCGVGGHISEIETDNEVKNKYIAGLQRELFEEVGLTSDKYTSSIISFIYDDSNSVGKVHFCITNLVKLQENVELIFKDHALSLGGFEKEQTIINNKSVFENWSKIIIENHLVNT